MRDCGGWQIFFSGGGGECDRGSNVLGFQGGEVGENLFGGISGCEVCEDGAECDASSFEDGFTAAYAAESRMIRSSYFFEFPATK